MSRSSSVPLGLAALLFLVLGIFVARNLSLSTGIAHLLPESRDQDLARVSAGLVDSPVTRSMVLAIFPKKDSMRFNHEPCFGVKINSNRLGTSFKYIWVSLEI